MRIGLVGRLRLWAAFCFLIVAGVFTTQAQDRLKNMPGYEQYQKMSKEAFSSVKMGTASVSWKEGGKIAEYKRDGKTYRFDFESNIEKEFLPEKKDGKEPAAETPPMPKGGRRGGGGGPDRGRQFGSATAPDGKHKAVYRERNLYLTDADGKNEIALSTDGNEKSRLKYGSASWVYGEELRQRTAFWWSPDSKKLAFYRFDESKVQDYFLQLNQTSVQDKVDAEPYPKTGSANPICDILIYDLESKKTTQADVRDGMPFDNNVVGHYVYDISWSADSKELILHRTNRRQNILELAACDPETGKCRVIIHEEWLPSWVENSPPMRFLKDNKRFLWESQRTGWKNIYLYELSGKLLATLTNHEFEVANILKVDEEAGYVYYMAHDGDNPMKLQLHRVGLDGKGDVRLTDPAFYHTVDVAPDGKHFLDTIQTHDTPPTARICDLQGKVLVEIAKSDMSKFEKVGLKKVELLTFRAADGKTDLYGMLHFPSNFNPNKKYPLLVTVYAGPETNGARETFTLPNAMTEYGFLVASFDSRSAAGRGKKILDSIYLKLGITEIDDQAAGVKSLWVRPYLDRNRVGIFGTSYGGTASALCLVRYPDVFQAAAASSPVTDFRLYDTIYTERYMWLPQENKAGYDAGTVMTYADKLKGRLMVYYGTADNNVHPSNALQLIRALQRAGKSFEVQVGPDMGHTSVNQQRMMEFFIENLVIDTPAH
ncbi:DPP IV N-terminal domain-containing protein [Telmatocola sphagniphila]|uniref:DPP IV N-terminal domain-containing protein n=1 Tax=Telmatocola sphagniphila TaxID=1123043 RepID=A0A8E6EY15_9BACT|nr:DPP IV N-terminal domain-containing protein [Telmatocola sphagniphila]QVL31901.1 DPP IV N-terminal domain-containing protein [Telmatocola sphagniphila]